MASRFEEGKCGFCNEKHIIKGQTIFGWNDEKNNKTYWGDPKCYKREVIDRIDEG